MRTKSTRNSNIKFTANQKPPPLSLIAVHIRQRLNDAFEGL
jgi:hypothetical protein